MLGTDICYAPILTLEEAASHPHNSERETFSLSEGLIQASPAPRCSRTSPQLPELATAAGSNTEEILAGLGMKQSEIEELKAGGAVA